MKKSIIIFFIFFFAFACLTAFMPIIKPALAGNPFDLNQQEGFSDKEIPSAYGSSSGKPLDIRIIVVQIIKAILGLLATVFLVLIIHAGFKWMTSGGSEEKTKQARDQIIHAIIGLLIVMCSYAITVFVVELVVKGTDGFWIF